MSEADHDMVHSNPVGVRLRAAREAKGLSLDDVARQTRIPTRHLQHIEEGEWDALPATTYSVGFARSYANAIGLNGNEIGAEVRELLGATPAYAAPATAYYEPADPARVPPRSLAWVAAAIALLLVIGYMVWRSGSVDDSAAPDADLVAAETATPPPAAPQPAPAPAPATGPVVLTATDDVWLRIYEGNGGPRIREATLKAGERYEIPATAKAPQILTGRPDALRVTVGTTEIPQLGPAQKTIADVSLLPADLLARVPGAQPAAPAAPGAPQSR